MPSSMHGVPSPYRLVSNVVYFHDWRYVNTGGFRWVSQDGKPVPGWGLEPVPPMRCEFMDMPLGIRLIAQRPTKTNPVFTPAKAKDIFLFAGTLIHEEGRYRLWYDCWPKEQIGSELMGDFNYVRYAESDNGMDWKLPSLGLIEYQGSRDNNLVYGPSLTPETGYHGGCVFKDPSAPPAERYKAFYLGLISKEALAKYRKERPNDVDPSALYSGFPLYGGFAVYGAVSPDGLKWTPIPEPLVMQCSDTHNVCTYDVVTKKYVAYCRSWFFGRRTIGRMETDDFRRFPLPEELFWPNAMMSPYETWYANAKTMMPGTTDYHIMFPMRWSLVEDKFDFHLATSPEGIVWGFVPGGPICEPGPPGAWDAGVVAPGLGLVNLPEERIGIMIAGSPVPHKYPRRPPLGALGWAWWSKDRLVALQSPAEGFFALWPLKFVGRTVHLNFRTGMAGYLQVEVLGPDGNVLPGRRFDQCDRLNGDYLDYVVTWKGQKDLGHPEGEAVTLRFRMRSAALFAVRFK